MTKKPSHLHTAEEPKELGPEPVDITGKEPVHVRDWDESSLVNAIRNCQVDIIEDELAYLLEKPYWQQPRNKPYRHEIGEGKYDTPADLVDKTLDMCRLDNVPVRRTVEVPWGPQSLDEQIETRFHEAIDHVNQHVEQPLELTAEQRQVLYYQGLPE